MTKLDNEHEVISVDGCFIRLKTPPNINKLTNGNTSNSEKSKDNIEIKVKVVSTQLTQNGLKYKFFKNFHLKNMFQLFFFLTKSDIIEFTLVFN